MTSRFALPALALTFAALGASLTLAGCGGGGDASPPVTPPPASVAAVTVQAPASTLVVGHTVQLSASVTDAAGRTLSGRAVTWASSDAAIAGVDATGLVTGVAPGAVTITATSEGKSGSAALTVAPPAIASIALAPTAPVVIVGASTALAATVRDVDGNVVTGRALDWRSSDAAIATVDSAGTVRGVAIGVATISASLDGRSGSADVVVSTAALPTIASVAPDTLVSGGTATIRGGGFAPTLATNTVSVGGTAATVTAASDSLLVVTLPTFDDCNAAGSVALTVGTPAGSATARPAVLPSVSRSMVAGDVLVLTGDADTRCNQLPASGRYIVSVFNAATTVDARESFELRGSDGVTPTAVARPDPRRTGIAPRAIRRADPELARERAHVALLERSAALARRAGPALPLLAAARRARGARSLASSTIGTVGAINTLRVPNVSGGAFGGNFCNDYTPVDARTVYVGTRAIVLEDTTSANASLMDAQLTALGQEFDATMYDVVASNVGDPLLLDAQLGGTGRVLMLFSPRVNGSGFSAFVVGCDFYPQSTFASSNLAEVFYGAVPSSSQTPDGWLRTMRSTAVHELEHVAAFAEHVAHGTSFEESWLEEGSARVIEELWGRRVFGYGATDDVDYQRGLYCEARPDAGGCPNAPQVMQKHFIALYDYLVAHETLSPLGRPSGTTDFTFYASAWSLIRWAIDHSGQGDSTFLQALVREPALRGAANLEARAGMPFSRLLALWSLTLATDDAASPDVAGPLVQLPSWNLPDVFRGLGTDFPERFPTIPPLQPRPVAFGAFAVGVAGLPGGTAALFDFSGNPGAQQYLVLHARPGSPLGVAIARVE